MASEGNPVSKAITQFCLSLVKKLSEDDSTANLFLSPFSISSALAMVMLGAAGDTASQMSKVLCFNKELEETGTQQQTRQPSKLPDYLLKILNKANEDAIKPPEVDSSNVQPQSELNKRVSVHFSKLLSELNKNDAPYALSVANRLYAEKTYQFIEEFLAVIKKDYKAEVELVDFKAEETRTSINNWVETQTQGKIKEMLGEGALDSLTKLVLVNAIYFKGNWNQKFKEEETRDATFKINKNDTKEVKMMQLNSKFPFAVISDLSCQVLEMPYKGKDLSMLIFLPDQIEDDSTGLEKLVKELTFEKFVKLTGPDMMRETQVQVGLPRFKLEETYDMEDVLVRMGMVDAFNTAKSNFSRMSPANDLVLSKVVHKAYVGVDEEGTEAAAATSAAIGITSIQIFQADHPFLFFIRHNPSSTILFGGKFCSPV